MKANPIILDSPDDAGHCLTHIIVKENESKTEKWLQELLYKHPNLLPIDAFDDSYGPPIPIGREVCHIDNLYVSPEGNLTIVETKLWKNPDKHRTVVAQVIDYARELAKWDYDKLCSAVLESSRKRGEDEKASLKEKVEAALSKEDMQFHKFEENVVTCLKEGSFLLLVVGDQISPNLALLTKAIQSAPGLHFTLGLVEMQLYKITEGSEWPLIVVPNVVGRTVEKTRNVVRIQYDDKKPKITVDVDNDDDVGTSPTKALDRDKFLRDIPPDLVVPYKEGFEEWENTGGTIHCTRKRIFLEQDVRGQKRKIVRCATHKVTIIRRTDLENWGVNPELHSSCLNSLESAPKVCDHARTGPVWITYANLNGDDLCALLRAARELVQRIKSKE